MLNSEVMHFDKAIGKYVEIADWKTTEPSTGDEELDRIISLLGDPDELEAPLTVDVEAARPISGERSAVPRPSGGEIHVETSEKVVDRLMSDSDTSVFPRIDSLEFKEFDDPRAAMVSLCQSLLIHKDYASVRDEYCRLSIQLNVLGKLAPGFRPILKPGAPHRSEVHNIVNRDQIVIDLHWCHATGMSLSPKDPTHQSLFSDNEHFNFELAWILACKRWTVEFRATEAMCLTIFQQAQMQALRGAEVAARLTGAGEGWRSSSGKKASRLSTLKRRIGEWAERDKRIAKERDSYEKLWLAREALGRAKPNNQLIAELHALMMGSEQQDRGSIRDKLKSLDTQAYVA